MNTNSNFILRNIYGKHILVPIRLNQTSNDPILLNEVAANIWNMAANGLTEEELLKRITQMYALKPESSELIAVTQFIEQMKDMSLLTTFYEEK